LGWGLLHSPRHPGIAAVVNSWGAVFASGAVMKDLNHQEHEEDQA
jgi:hypothetical protein